MKKLLTGAFLLGSILSADAQQATSVGPNPPAGIFTVTGALRGNGAGTITQALCADLSNSSVYCAATTGQLPGIATNTAASAGNIGELLATTVGSGSAVSLSLGVSANIASVSLTAGEWDITATGYFALGATTNVTTFRTSISQTSATLDGTPGSIINQTVSPTGVVLGNSVDTSFNVGPVRVRLSAPTSFFLVEAANFTVSTASGYGIIRATRIH